MAKAARSSEKVPKSRAALTPEAREKQLIALAIDVAEEQMRNGTASSQVISHFLKLGSTRAQIEKELLEKQRDLAAAKAEAIESSAKMEDLYLKAAKATQRGLSKPACFDLVVQARLCRRGRLSGDVDEGKPEHRKDGKLRDLSA